MAANEGSVSHVQAKFFTKQAQYSVPDNAFSIPSTVGVPELSVLINSLLAPSKPESQQVSFDFLIQGQFLRIPLDKHLEEKQISSVINSPKKETVVEIEYVESHPPPEPEDSLLHDDWVSAVHARNDFLLTGAYDNTVRVWNTEGDCLVTIPAHSGPVKSIRWLHNDDESGSARFVTGSHDGTALLWQWNRSQNAVECSHTCRGHAGSVDSLGVNSDATKFCSGSWDKMLKVWSALPGQDDTEESGEKPAKRKKTEGKIPTRVPQVTLSGHNEGVSSSLWLNDAEICTSSWDHTIKLWDMEQMVEKSSLLSSKAIFDISYSHRTGLLVAGSADRHVRLFDPRSTEGSIVKGTFTSHKVWVVGVHWSPIDDHHFISGSYDHLVKLWDTRNPKTSLYDLSGHEDKVLCVDWSMPQYLLSGSSDNTLKIFRYMDKQAQGLHMDS